jgi:hypothetical protein
MLPVLLIGPLLLLWLPMARTRRMRRPVAAGLAGLTARVAPTGDGDCGSAACTRTITVAGRPGQSADALRAEVERHVRSRGWGTGCRPAGWLLNQATECLELTAVQDHLTIQLSGLRGPAGG